MKAASIHANVYVRIVYTQNNWLRDTQFKETRNQMQITMHFNSTPHTHRSIER